MTEAFRHLARTISNLSGSAGAFAVALALIIAWGVSGPLFGFSDTWQLVINTGTTIVTFLMVFLIQNTQNRDSQALHAKIDELLVVTKGARNWLAGAEELSDDQLLGIKQQFERIAQDDPVALDEAVERANGDRPERVKRRRSLGRLARIVKSWSSEASGRRDRQADRDRRASR
jgi:low affinity Fe/Cu permease